MEGVLRSGHLTPREIVSVVHCIASWLAPELVWMLCRKLSCLCREPQPHPACSLFAIPTTLSIPHPQLPSPTQSKSICKLKSLNYLSSHSSTPVSNVHLSPPVETYECPSREQTIKMLTFVGGLAYGPLQEWTHKQRRWFIRSNLYCKAVTLALLVSTVAGGATSTSRNFILGYRRLVTHSLNWDWFAFPGDKEVVLLFISNKSEF